MIPGLNLGLYLGVGRGMDGLCRRFKRKLGIMGNIEKKNVMARPRGRRNFLVLSGIDSANECWRICNGKKSIYTYVYLFPLCVQ